MACATPWGRGALATLRLSGLDLVPVRDALLAPRSARPWVAGRVRRVDVRDVRGPFDDGLAVWLPGPGTVTGEDVLEVTIHGNPLLVERGLAAAVEAGARLARPGEFTRRAVAHGKLDLVQAEAVDQVVRARTSAGVTLARAALGGGVSAELAWVRDAVVGACAELEARLDHPDDALADVDDVALKRSLLGIAQACRSRAAGAIAGQRLVDGATVALVGAVNAGKSSLFNRLVGARRALVHDTPGTTRDVVEARALVGPLEITLLDTAGRRPTDDPVEAAGLALAEERVADADLVLVVLRAGPEPDAVGLGMLQGPRVLGVYNGIDRPDAGPCPPGCLPTCALDGRGIDGLRDAVRDALIDVPLEEVGLASQRHADALREVARACEEAADAMDVAGVAVASEILLDAITRIDELTGADTREDVLDALFARFCIGK